MLWTNSSEMEEELQFTVSPRWDGDAETEKILVIWWLNMF